MRATCNAVTGSTDCRIVAAGFSANDDQHTFAYAFYLAYQTFSTVGFGTSCTQWCNVLTLYSLLSASGGVYPQTRYTNVVIYLLTLTGLVTTTVFTGLIFSKVRGSSRYHVNSTELCLPFSLRGRSPSCGSVRHCASATTRTCPLSSSAWYTLSKLMSADTVTVCLPQSNMYGPKRPLLYAVAEV